MVREISTDIPRRAVRLRQQSYFCKRYTIVFVHVYAYTRRTRSTTGRATRSSRHVTGGCVSRPLVSAAGPTLTPDICRVMLARVGRCCRATMSVRVCRPKERFSGGGLTGLCVHFPALATADCGNMMLLPSWVASIRANRKCINSTETSNAAIDYVVHNATLCVRRKTAI